MTPPSAPRFEVEVKYRLAANQAELLTHRLEELGARAEPSQRQIDLYFAHPARNFASTDEALRLRTAQGVSTATYKGPKQDTSTKTRLEVETPIQDPQGFVELMRALGFRDVRHVDKLRSTYVLSDPGGSVEVSIDRVEGLGVFAEIETMAEAHEVDRARSGVLAWGERLGLKDMERRGYIEMLLASAPNQERP